LCVSALNRTEPDMHCRRSKFFELRRRLEIPSVRKNPASKQEQLEALNELSEKNPDGSWGVAQTRGRLAQTGVLATRSGYRLIGTVF
jgi:hypothetical protein